MNNSRIRSDFAYILQKLEEAKNEEIPVSIGSEVIGTVKKSDAETIDNIKRAVGSSDYRDAILTFLQNEVNLSPEHALHIFEQLSKGTNLEVFSDYLFNKRADIGQYIGKKVNVPSLLSNVGINSKIGSWFFAFKTATSPMTGPSEIFMSIFFKGGKRPTSKEKGDVRINDMEVEVKADKGRLMGQSGYGDATLMRQTLKQAVKNIADNLKATFPASAEVTKDNAWNITKKMGGELENSLMQISKEIGGFKPKDIQFISSEIIKANVTVFKGIDANKLSGALTGCIDKSGKINTDLYHKTMVSISFDYYHQIEGFQLISVVSPNKGLMLIISPSDFHKYVSSGEIDYTPPSYTDGAGKQGGVYAIQLK